MFDLKKLLQNPVTLLKIHYEPEVYTKIPNFILKHGKATIFSMVDESSQCDNLNKLTKNKHLTYLDFHQLKDIILTNLREKRDEIDFCSILIINDIHTLTLEKLVIINLWKECYKISSKRPYLIITTFSEYTPEFPFQLSRDACQVFGEDKKQDIEYHDTNFSPNSSEIEESLSQTIIKKQREIPLEKGESTWLVFYCGKENLSKNLYQKIGKEANIYTTKSIKKLNKFYSDKKRNIIILCNDYIPPTLMNDVDGVFDSMTVNFGENINYTTKQVSEIRGSYQIDGFVYRLCTYDYYKELPRITQRKYENSSIDKYYLEILQSSQNIENIFGSIVSKTKIEKDIRYLEEHSAISGKTITRLGDFIIHLPLITENCSLLFSCYSASIAIFPVLVACVFSEIKESLFYETKESGNVFHDYLRIFNTILMKNSDLEDINVTELCKEKKMKSHILNDILEKLKQCITILREKLKISVEIGVYDSDNLVKTLIPHYEKSYFSETYILIDKDNMLYKNKDSIFKLNQKRFNYSKDSVPSKLFCFYRARTNEERHSIQRGKNVIYYYIPS